MAVDNDLAKQVGSKLPLTLEIPKSNAGNTLTGDKVKDWINSYFHMTPTVAALTILSKFQNDVKNSENIAAAFCANQVSRVCRFCWQHCFLPSRYIAISPVIRISPSDVR